MGRYAEYGLEDDKNKPVEPGEGGKRVYFCPFTQDEYKRGFYLGLAHFIASKVALLRMERDGPEPAGSKGRWTDCFRCKNKKVAFLHYLESPTLGICTNCADTGVTLLRRGPLKSVADVEVPYAGATKEHEPMKPLKVKFTSTGKRRPPKPAFPVLAEPVRALVPGMQLALFG